YGDPEGGDKARTVFGRVPVGEIKDDARKEPGFGDAEQEAKNIKTPYAARERHQRRNDAPRHHDAGDPAAGAESFQSQIAWHLENKVADEEDAGAPRKDR